MRTLVIVRHATAATPADVDDVERPLVPRGRRDAAAAGRWLADRGIEPQLVVCSPARRALETLSGIVEGLGAVGTSLPRVIQEQVYEATLSDLMRVVRGFDDAAPTTVVVGHNPGLSELVIELTGEPMVLATAALVVVDLRASSWAEAAVGCGTVRCVGVGRA